MANISTVMEIVFHYSRVSFFIEKITDLSTGDGRSC